MQRFALGPLGIGVALMVALHLIPPTDRISPVRRTLSEYALGPNKWIFDVAVLAVAVGSALVFADLLRRRQVRPLSAPVALGLLWIASLLTVVAFTKTNWAVGPSMGGVVHRYASLVGFVALPIAVFVMAGTVYRDAPGWRRTTRGLALLSLSAIGMIMVGVVNMLAGGPPWWLFLPLGLVERFMAFMAVAAIAAVAVGPRPDDHSVTNQTPTAGSVPSLR